MPALRAITDDVSVCGQILPQDLAALAALGVKSIICNRPDDEAMGQPSQSDVKTAAQALGLDFAFLPMSGGLSQDLILANESLWESMPRPILAYCASGTRSAALWCFGHVKDMGTQSVLEKAESAGYALEQLRSALEAHARAS